MHIKKNENLNYQLGVQRNGHEQQIDHGKKSIPQRILEKNIISESKESLGIDKVRNQVMNLHDEVKSIQTKISQRQIQIAFLDNLPNKQNWKENLVDFLGSQVSKSILIKPEPDLNSYLQKLNKEITELNSDMLTKEVKLENIISSGVMDTEKTDLSEIIIKDMQKAKEVFSKIKADSITRVLKN